MIPLTATSSFSVPVSLIRQYCFCCRIPFFSLTQNINPPKSGWVQKGQKTHIGVENLMKRRDLSRLGLCKPYELKQEVSLSSPQLHIHGICDGYIQTQNPIRLFPFDIKSNPYRKPSRGEIHQLCAYAMLLEESRATRIDTCFLLLGRKSDAYTVMITDQLRAQTLEIIERIIKDCELSVLPDSDANVAKCAQCEFINFCGDRL